MDVADVMCEWLRFCDVASLMACRLTCRFIVNLIDNEWSLWLDIAKCGHHLLGGLIFYKIKHIRRSQSKDLIVNNSNNNNKVGIRLIRFLFPLTNNWVSEFIESIALAFLGVSDIRPLDDELEVNITAYDGVTPKVGDHLWMPENNCGCHAIVSKVACRLLPSLSISMHVCVCSEKDDVKPQVMEINHWIDGITYHEARCVYQLHYDAMEDSSEEIAARLEKHEHAPVTWDSASTAFLLTTGKYLEPERADALKGWLGMASMATSDFEVKFKV